MFRSAYLHRACTALQHPAAEHAGPSTAHTAGMHGLRCCCIHSRALCTLPVQRITPSEHTPLPEAARTHLGFSPSPCCSGLLCSEGRTQPAVACFVHWEGLRPIPRTCTDVTWEFFFPPAFLQSYLTAALPPVLHAPSGHVL